MPHQRNETQAVEAFSAPKDLLLRAKARAAELGMTKSGFFRYVLALELGHSEAEARGLADHRAVTQLRESVEEDRRKTFKGRIDERQFEKKERLSHLGHSMPADNLNEEKSAELPPAKPTSYIRRRKK